MIRKLIISLFIVIFISSTICSTYADILVINSGGDNSLCINSNGLLSNCQFGVLPVETSTSPSQGGSNTISEIKKTSSTKPYILIIFTFLLIILILILLLLNKNIRQKLILLFNKDDIDFKINYH